MGLPTPTAAPSYVISADRTLLLRIGPFVLKLSESRAFLRIYKRSINAKRMLSMPSELGGLNEPSLELDVEHLHYASFTTTLANLIIDHESEMRSPMHGIIRQDLMDLATSTLP
jgi:hypothetical protein